MKNYINEDTLVPGVVYFVVPGEVKHKLPYQRCK